MNTGSIHKILIVVGLCAMFLVPGSLFAQQETIYSQYMFNRLAVNPAYAGTKGLVSLTALYRMQWVNFDGTPRSFSLTGHGASRNMKHGFGAMFMRDELGAQRNTLFGINYAYRIALDGKKSAPNRTFLSFGLQAAGYQYELDGSKVRTFQPDDPAFGSGTESMIVPDFGAGVFFNTSMFYAGLSVAHLTRPEINLMRGNEDNRLDRHVFFTTGIDLPLTSDRNYILTPSLFYRGVRSADPQFDFNLNFMMIQKFWIGGGYRLDDAAVFMAGFYPTKQLRVGYSYDLTTSKLNAHQNGTHEIMVSFDFGNPNKVRVVTPRYF